VNLLYEGRHFSELRAEFLDVFAQCVVRFHFNEVLHRGIECIHTLFEGCDLCIERQQVYAEGRAGTLGFHPDIITSLQTLGRSARAAYRKFLRPLASHPCRYPKEPLPYRVAKVDLKDGQDHNSGTKSLEERHHSLSARRRRYVHRQAHYSAVVTDIQV